MDATLAFVTASFARVRPGDLVLDPFCGAPAESTATPSSRRRVDGAEV